MRLWLAIKLRDLSFWLLGYEHCGGGWDGTWLKFYAKPKRSQP